MQLTYLGTAAAEGFPAVFCACPFCVQARALGGKNLRTRSQALIDDQLLLDLPADSYSHFLNNGIEAEKIRYLFVTHSHSDHFYPAELKMRHPPYAHNMAVPRLQVFCGTGAREKLPQEVPGCEITVLHPFDTVHLEGYTVTALPARHAPGDGALFYCIEGDKTLLYAHDTGFFYDEVFSWIDSRKLHFDMISLDCTNVDIPIGDDGPHMGLANIARLLSRLEMLGAIDTDTKRYINHFSHNGAPLHEVLCERIRPMGLHVSHDGLCLRL